MRAALSRAAKKGIHRADAGPGASAHASRSDAVDWRALAPRPSRLRAERRVRRTRLGAATRVGQACHYGYDAHGNITFLTDSAGVVTDSYDYDAWGNVLATTGSTPNTRLFAGEELDPDLGWINLRARYYKPSTGRFLAIDPLDGSIRAGLLDSMGTSPLATVSDPYVRALADVSARRVRASERLFAPVALHRYLYANADPITLTDPSGLAVGVEYGILQKKNVPVAPAVVRVGKFLRCELEFTVYMLFCASLEHAGVPEDLVLKCMSDARLFYVMCKGGGGPPN